MGGLDPAPVDACDSGGRDRQAVGLRATREQLLGKPTRELEPSKVAEKTMSTFTSASTTKPSDTYSTTAT